MDKLDKLFSEVYDLAMKRNRTINEMALLLILLELRNQSSTPNPKVTKA